MKHTPGPWRRTEGGMYIVAGGQTPITPPKTIACSPSPYTWSKADVDLIMAAPDMLEALKSVVEMDIKIDMEYFPAFKAAMDKVSDAIQKAGGA